MGEPTIKNLEEIIGQRLTRNEIITKTEVLKLLGPGENYMSEMMKVQVTTKNRITEAEREIHAVAKLTGDPPGRPGDEKTKVEFSTCMFKKEMSFYSEIVPAIQSFLKRRGMSPAEYFVEYYGGRLNLNGGDSADKDAVLLLENLHTNGYQNMDRYVGFDLEGAKVVLKDLAHFHSVCVAMKLLEPEVFQKTIMKNCEIKPPHPPPPSANGPGDKPKPPGPMEMGMRLFMEVLEDDKACSPAIPAFKKVLEERKEMGFDAMFNEKQREPFATLAHSDMWMNNTMQTLDNKGRPTKNKLVDFQMYCYNSPARDLHFFLQTSVALSVLKTHLDYLMKLYHDNFVKVLVDAGCDIAPFSYDKFLEEVKAVVPSLLTDQGSFMLMIIIFGKKGTAVDPSQVHNITKDDVDPRAADKFRFNVLEAYRRGWLG